MTLRVSVVAAVGGVLLAGLFWAGGPTAAEPLGVDATGAAGAGQKIPEIEDAVARFKLRDFAGAFKFLEDAVKANPDLPPAELLMAQLFGQANIPAGVRAWLERAAWKVPKDPQAFVIMGELALRERQVTEADLLFAKAESLMKDFSGSQKRKDLLQPQILAGLATVAEAREEWPAAQKLLEAWLKLETKDANIMQRIARALFQQKEKEKNKDQAAYDMLQAAKKADPSNVLTPEAQMALWYETRGDHESAVRWMSSALKTTAPKEPAKQYQRTMLVAADWALNTDQMDNAKKWAVEALQIDSSSQDALILRGVVALHQKDFKEAEVYFEQVAIASPTHFPATNNLALALVEQDDQKKKKKALEYASINARVNQPPAEAVSTLGWVLYKNGRVDEADKVLTDLIQRVPSVSSDTAYYLAVISAEKERPEEAKQLVRAALQNNRPFYKRDEAKALLEQLERGTRKPGAKPAGKPTGLAPPGEEPEKPAAKGKGGTDKGGDDKKKP